MPTTRFTDRWLRSLSFDGTRREYADSTCPGLRVRVGARGVQFSALVRTPDGRRRRVPLGTFPETSLAEARRALAEVDPAALAPADAEPDAAPPAGPRAGTVGDMIALALDHYAARGTREITSMRTYLERGTVAAIHTLGADTPAAAVTPEDVTAWLRKVHAAGVQTYHPRNYLSRAFSLAMKSDYDPTSPAADLRFGIVANPVTPVVNTGTGVRDRVLDLDELAAIVRDFRGRHVAPTTRAVILALVAMGGVRVSEIVRARREWIESRDGRPWLCVPATKNGHPHDLPTTAAFQRIVAAMDPFAPPGSPVLFPSPRRPGEPIDLTSLAQSVRRWCAENGVTPWQPRDLRRTMKTHLLERRPDLRDALDIWHNHGRTADVARRHYDRATYAAAKIAVAREIDAFVEEVERRAAADDDRTAA